MSAIAYRPEVDGLRAVAILGVLLFHVFPRLLPGGFAGVDVFFVISGYLITSILLEEIQKGIFSLKRFYLRRVRRLFPALAIVLLVILIVSPLLNPFSTSTVRSAVTWVLLLSGNIFIWRATGDYWGPNVDENPLLHTWSLGVEEQFYLLFPLTLLLLMRFGRRRAFQLLALFCLGSFLCCVVGTRVRPSAAFYLPLTRAWELLAGCLLAFKARNPVAPLAKNNRSGLWAGIGLVLIVISYATLKGDHSFPGFKAALPVLGSVIVIGFTGRGTGAADWLLKRPAMVFIGKISYSLYLWHWPVLVFLRQISENPLLPPLLPREFTGVGCFILSTLLALASYAVIERPGRAWTWTPLASAFTGIALLVFTSWSGFTQRTGAQLAEGFAPITVAGRLYSVNQNLELSPAVQKKYASVRLLVPERPNPIEEGLVRPGTSNAPPAVLVFGDSHSTMFAPMIDQILLKHGISGRFVIADAEEPRLIKDRYEDNPNFGTAADIRRYDETRKKLLDVHRPKLTLWIQRYDFSKFEDIEASIQYVTERSTCVFFQQAPVLNTGDYCSAEVFGFLRNVAHKDLHQIRVAEPRSIGADRHSFETALLSKFGQNKKFVWFPTQTELTAPDGHIKWWDGVSKLYYLDDDHLSEYGVDLFRDRLENLILEKLNLAADNSPQVRPSN